MWNQLVESHCKKQFQVKRGVSISIKDFGWYGSVYLPIVGSLTPADYGFPDHCDGPRDVLSNWTQLTNKSAAIAGSLIAVQCHVFRSLSREQAAAQPPLAPEAGKIDSSNYSSPVGIKLSSHCNFWHIY